MPSLSSYRQFEHLRIPFQDIAYATDNFSDSKVIRQSGYEKEYRGTLQLLGKSIDIVARRLDPTYGHGDKEFATEILMLSTLRHENIVSLIGFCDENNERIIINKNEVNGSLDQHLRDPTVTWMRRLEICVGMARALSYIHYDERRDFSVVHRNIKSSNLLLDENWKPKLSGFGLSMKTTINRRHRLLLGRVGGTIGYTDPVYEKTGGVTHKSDMYSLGVVLFEVLCGRTAYIKPDQRFSANLAKQDPEEESPDFAGKGDQIVEHEVRQLEKQHSTEGSPDVLEELDEAQSALQSSTQESPDVVGKLDERISVKQRSTEGSYHVSEEFNEARSPESALQSSLQESPDVVVGKFDEKISPQHSTEGSCDVLEELDEARAPQWSNQSELIAPPFSGGDKPSGSALGCGTFSGLVHQNISTYMLELGEAPGLSDFYLRDRSMNGIGSQNRFIETEDLLKLTIASPMNFRYCLNMLDEDHLLAPLAISGYEQGKLEGMIATDLWKQMDPQSFQVFSETAYYCLKEKRSERPDIDQICIRLRKALDHQRKYEIPEHSEGTSTNHSKGGNLKHLEIPLSEIKLATENFAEKYLIGAGTYGEVYRAQLYHFDSENHLPFKHKNIGEFPKKHSTVAIKRIKLREDKQGEGGFHAEIELLTNCTHPNIVSLLGFCEEGNHMILVYEYASSGSLEDYIGIRGSLTNLTWVQRIKICIDVARGLDYLHTKIEGEQRIIHRDIKSGNILLGVNYDAKIADFGLSRFLPEVSQQVNRTLYTPTLAGTEFYWDPVYVETGKLKNESDIYSLGVVLFEVMAGRFANDPIFTKESSNGIAHVARRRFKEGRNSIKEMLDPRLMEETHENIFTLNKGPDQESLDIFSKIAYQCVAETQAERPTAEVVRKKLEQALFFQENIKDSLGISLEDVKSATNTFSDDNRIGGGGFGSVYKGEVANADGGHTYIAAKRLDKRLGQGETEFLTELEILMEYKHENIIGLVGYCNQKDERIIVSEYASRGSLDSHLSNSDLTWRKRLQICIDIASGLDFLHGGNSPLTNEALLHRDLKSSNILLTDEWKAKISDFGLSIITPINVRVDIVVDNVCGTIGYCDPEYMNSGFLTRESDMYSFGVVLIEILFGRLVRLVLNGYDPSRTLTILFKRHYEGKGAMIVFEGIKEQVAPKSLTIFERIAYQCLHNKQSYRPTASEVLLQLKKALEFQDDYDLWEPKLPKDYQKIIEMTNSPAIINTEKKEDLYNMLSKGILLKDRKVFFSLDDCGERIEMISARKFSYKHRRSHKWRSIPESRFDKVAEMLDISNLKVQVKIKPQILSPGVKYGVHLVFRFCGPRKSLAKQMYVNLGYKKGSETLHAYFATWREDGWMMIELCQFFNQEKDSEFECLLESFSRGYCESRGVYIEGIEFRVSDKVKHAESNNLKEVQHVEKSNLDMDQVQKIPTNFEILLSIFENNSKSGELFLRNKVNKKKSYMLSAKEALYGSYDVKLFSNNSSTHSRFPEVIELQRQQVFHIKCTIESQMLSPDAEYTCHLVFKISQNCSGLHCPVIVRNLLSRKNKEKKIVYFRSPSPCNVNDTDRVPEEREDGWMEVNVLDFNSSNNLRDDCVSIVLKLISYEGNMSGLIVSSLEFRPM